MNTKKATLARNNFFSLMDEVNNTEEPILVTGKRNNVVLISESNWRAVQETLYLLSIPKMRESITNAIKMPLSKCSKSIHW